MSNLKNKVGFPILCSSRNMFCLCRKLSYIILFFMNALWALDTIWFRSPLNLTAIILDTSLATLSKRLIGLKSFRDFAFAFFGIRITCSLFSKLKYWSCWLKKLTAS